MSKLILIDGNSLINRAFYATTPLSTKDGTPTNAVYAFINMLLKIIGDLEPTHMLVAFDRKEPTFRHVMYSDYKGTRKPMPEELRPQINIMKDVLDSMDIARYEQAGIEADDIIGTLAKKFPVETVIITGDKDSFQLVDESTSVYFTRKGITELEVYNADNFKEKTGIEPLQIIELKAMMGDASDNIPGIAGVGEKTAVSLIEQFGSIDELYLNTDKLKGKLKEKVESSKDSAYLSRTLATINTKVEIPLTLPQMTVTFPFPLKARDKFAELEFRSFTKRDDIFSSDKAGMTVETKSPDVMPEIVEIDSVSQFPNFANISKISIYIGENISFYDCDKEYFVKIKNNFFDDGVTPDEAFSALSVFFGDPDKTLVVFSKKDLMKQLDEIGIKISAKVEDVSLKQYVVDQSKQDGIDGLISLYGKPTERPAYSVWSIDKELTEAMVEDGVYKLYSDIELPLVEVLFTMEKNGFKIDRKSLYDMSVRYSEEIKDLQEEIFEAAGERFNPNSSKQLANVLFVKLGLKTGKKNQSGFSTSAEVLEQIEERHPVVPLILKYRQIQKLYSTYIEGFKPLIDPKTGLVHTTFYQTLTTTGRLSSREPNLQNIPVREAEGKEIRKLFISSFENGKIVGADYSQIELRLLAHFSGCEPLIESFKSGEDIHALTASQVFGVPIGEVTSEMRRSAKAVNFGIIYGISDFGLSRQLKISPKHAGEYIKKYFEMYPSVKEYMDGNVEFAKKHGYVETLSGRKRYIKEINSPNYNLRSFGERAAMNMPLQGTAADIIKIAMIRVGAELKKMDLKAKLILQVHDELLVDTPDDEVEIVKKILVDCMENAVSLKVPLTVETECGARWFDAK